MNDIEGTTSKPKDGLLAKDLSSQDGEGMRQITPAVAKALTTAELRQVIAYCQRMAGRPSIIATGIALAELYRRAAVPVYWTLCVSIATLIAAITAIVIY